VFVSVVWDPVPGPSINFGDSEITCVLDNYSNDSTCMIFYSKTVGVTLTHKIVLYLLIQW
jgi:hypothetical protein